MPSNRKSQGVGLFVPGGGTVCPKGWDGLSQGVGPSGSADYCLEDIALDSLFGGRRLLANDRTKTNLLTLPTFDHIKIPVCLSDSYKEM